MDKLETYRNIIIDTLKEYSKTKSQNLSAVETQLVLDKENNHFFLYRVGWKELERIHYCVFHIDIKEERVWVQEDNTDSIIVDDLLNKGIPKTDIVLGFHAPYKRQFTGFAIV